AQRLLSERGDYRAAASLRKLVTTGPSPLARLHALWTLEGMHQLDSGTTLAALSDSDPIVRAAAIRLCEPLLSTDKRKAVLPALLKLSSDSDLRVQLQFALSMTGAANPDADAALATI